MRQKHLILSLLIVMLFGNYGYASYLELMRKYGYFNAQPPAIQAVSNIATTATPFPYGSYTNPQGQYADGMNLYQYVRSNPVKNVDSFGLQAFPFIYMQPAPPRRCGNCGPDITSKIDALNKELSSWFNDDLSPSERDDYCYGRVSLGGWEIVELKTISDLVKRDSSYKECATGDCKDTVQVHGRCQSPHEVNYYLYGVMTRLCADHFSDEIASATGNNIYQPEVNLHPQDPLVQFILAGIHTLFWDWKPGNDRHCKLAWMRAGFDGNPAGVSCGDRFYCKKDVCKNSPNFLSALWMSNDGGGQTIRIRGNK